MIYHSDRIQRLCFQCGKLSFYNRIKCSSCGSTANQPVGYEIINPSVYKQCRNCGKLNNKNNNICSCCGSHSLGKLKPSPDPGTGEIIFQEGIRALTSNQLSEAFGFFEKSGYVYNYELALMALAECYRLGLGTKKNKERVLNCLLRCKDQEARKKYDMYKKSCKDILKKDVLPKKSSISDSKPKANNKNTDSKKKEKASRKKEEIIACSVLLYNHPIVKKGIIIKNVYISLLEKAADLLNINTEYAAEYIKTFKKILKISKVNKNISCKFPDGLKEMVYFDIMALSGYSKKYLTSENFVKLSGLIKSGKPAEELIKKIFLQNNEKSSEELFNNKVFMPYSEWINNIIANSNFIQKSPYRILVTATMSAGKSTFINSIAGKKIAKTQNEACTGRVHYIFSKPYEDNLISKWEQKAVPVFDAADYIISEDETANESDSFESVYFSGSLGGERFVIIDTPGVNSSENKHHGDTTNRLILEKNYDLLVYIINYTVESTDDNKAHLDFIKENADKNRPVIFILNKVDMLDPDDLDLAVKIKQIKDELKNAGFKNAALYPLSASAGYFASDLSEKYNFSDPGSLMSLTADPFEFKHFSIINTLIQNKELHLEQFFDLPENNQIFSKLNSAIKSNNITEQAYIHSGVYSLMSVLSKYINQN